MHIIFFIINFLLYFLFLDIQNQINDSNIIKIHELNNNSQNSNFEIYNNLQNGNSEINSNLQNNNSELKGKLLYIIILLKVSF